MPNPTSKLLTEWAEGCSAETLEFLALAPSYLTPLDALERLMAADRDRAGSHADRCLRRNDADRLRTLILRRLGGAERVREMVRGKWHNQRVLARDVEEALDG